MLNARAIETIAATNFIFIPPIAIDVDDETVIDLQSITGPTSTPLQGMLLADVGDMLELWSGGCIKATPNMS